MTKAARDRAVWTGALVSFACLSSVRVAGQSRALRSPSASPVKDGLVNLTGSTIEYFSQGQGPPIVLLPFAGLTVGYMDGLAQDLSDVGYLVRTVILFAAGGKVPPKPPGSMPCKRFSTQRRRIPTF
jgi:hypothetical protein